MLTSMLNVWFSHTKRNRLEISPSCERCTVSQQRHKHSIDSCEYAMHSLTVAHPRSLQMWSQHLMRTCKRAFGLHSVNCISTVNSHSYIAFANDLFTYVQKLRWAQTTASVAFSKIYHNTKAPSGGERPSPPRRLVNNYKTHTLSAYKLLTKFSTCVNIAFPRSEFRSNSSSESITSMGKSLTLEATISL